MLSTNEAQNQPKKILLIDDDFELLELRSGGLLNSGRTS